LVAGVDVLHADELVRALEGCVANEARRVRIVNVEDGEETVGDLGVWCVEIDFADVVAAGRPVDGLKRLDVELLHKGKELSRELASEGERDELDEGIK
jgi:predicted N-acetyltransferase YhbS